MIAGIIFGGSLGLFFAYAAYVSNETKQFSKKIKSDRVGIEKRGETILEYTIEFKERTEKIHTEFLEKIEAINTNFNNGEI